jgi:Lrp/AsnC family transcriptional regulator, leucine-responsive regulatory protein
LQTAQAKCPFRTKTTGSQASDSQAQDFSAKRTTKRVFLRNAQENSHILRQAMPSHVKLDDLDERIIDLLREDARRTITDIAAHVNLSPAPVKRRIDRLEELGVITGYTVSVDHALIGPSIEAFTELRFAGDADIDEILGAVERIPEIREVFTMAGDPDALLRIRVNDVEHLKAVVNLLRRTGRVTGTKTLMVLDRWAR